MTNTRQYLIELGSALAAYGVLLFGAICADNLYHPHGALRVALAVTPIIGCVGALIAIMRAIRRMDELQRRVQFEALAFGFAVTALVTLTWGFLEGAGFPRFPVFGVWPLMAASWALGGAIAARRYR